MRIRSALPLRLLLCLLSVVLLVFILNALTVSQHVGSEVLVTHWDTPQKRSKENSLADIQHNSHVVVQDSENQADEITDILTKIELDGAERGKPALQKTSQAQLPQWKHQRHSNSSTGHRPKLGDLTDLTLHNGFTLLTQEVMESIETFVFFLGWQRSGHSIIGSLLDGHPDAVVAHEFFLFNHLHQFIHRSNSRSFLFNHLAANSYRQANSGFRSHYHNEKGYNLHLANSWQGRFRKLRVIGDKGAGDVTHTYLMNATIFDFYVRCLKSMVKIPIKVINVVRNPYDMIATLALYRGSYIRNVKVRATIDRKFTNLTVLREAAGDIIEMAYAVVEIEDIGFDWELKRIYAEDFIGNPASVMKELCEFLSLECTETYLQQCTDKAYKSTSKSRELVEWDQATKTQVQEMINVIPYFNQYSFND